MMTAAKFVIRYFLFFISAVLASIWLASFSAAQAQVAELMEALKRPGVHAMMRHSLAPGFSDPSGFRIDDCASQRNLNADGRAQAQATGRAFKAAGVVFTQVLTSQWCRCRETAALIDNVPPKDFTPLNSFFENRSASDAQTKDTLAMLRALPAQERVLLVTHQVNISALTNQGVGSGEVVVFTLDAGGKVQVLGEFTVQLAD